MTTPAYTATPCRASLQISTTSADANEPRAGALAIGTSTDQRSATLTEGAPAPDGSQMIVRDPARRSTRSLIVDRSTSLKAS